MTFAVECSQADDAAQAIDTVCAATAERLRGEPPDLSLAFVARAHREQFGEIVRGLQEQLRCRHLLACTAETVIANEREIEDGPALALWSARLPNADLESFHVEFERTPDGPICTGLPEPSSEAAGQESIRAVLLLADPYTCVIDTLIARLRDDFPDAPLLGGMASGGQAPGQNRLGWNGLEVEGGGVGVILRGGPRVRSIVSQGCRPIGNTLVVTRAEQNVVFELGGKPALARLEEIYAGLSELDRRLIRNGLHLGVVMDERKPSFTRGDFLIANVLGADRDTGAVAIGNLVRAGQTVQFHLRDADTADEDLRHLVSASLSNGGDAPAAALLFSCNGRGTRLFSKPDHDTGVVRELCGAIPVAGLFAQGELGPVGGRNFIHGFTASIALFDQA